MTLLSGVPLRLILIGAAILAVLSAATLIYWKGRHEGAALERPKTEAAAARATVATLETKGERESADRSAAVALKREQANQTVASITAQALKSEDAHAPLDPERAARLRAADGELCRADPELAGCAPAGDAG